ncbi:MAG: hypothetical protein E4G98_01660 [Promethearchaeota archaeon]|nr:MAG: hypothetical protein E4G98_01660 [Candidatus Lokiarchaeota archaeon]
MHRDPQSRLKLYIPYVKYALWERTLHEAHPNSLFFTNFNQWVRNSIQTLPNPGETPLYPPEQKPPNGGQLHSDNKKIKKIEKSLWIATKVKNALKIKSGYLSLNAYVILILDLAVFKHSSYDTVINQIFQLKDWVQKLEARLFKIQDEISLKLAQ